MGKLQRLILASACLIILSGNTDAEKLLAKPPALIADSSASPETVAACLAKEGFGGTPVIVPEGARRTVMINAMGHTIFVVTVDPSPTGSIVRLHRMMAFQGGTKAVARCATGGGS